MADFLLWKTDVGGLVEHPRTALSPFGKSFLGTVRDAWPGQPNCLWSLSPASRMARGTSPGGVVSAAFACLARGLAYRPDRLILTTLGFHRVELEKEKMEAAKRERAIEHFAVASDSGFAKHCPTIASLDEAIRFATGGEEEDPYYQPFSQEEEIRHLLAEGRPVNLAIVAPKRGGKTMLCNRLMDYASGLRQRVIVVDLPHLGVGESNSEYLRSICGQVANQIGVGAPTAAVWDASPQIPRMRLESFVERQLLPMNATGRLVLCIDKVHRLVGTPLQQEFYGMLRTWSELCGRPTMQGRRWRQLSILICSELDVDAYLENPQEMSLFNTFSVFHLAAVAEPQDYLKRYRPGAGEEELRALVEFSGGMPALIRGLAENPDTDFLTDKTATQRHFGTHLRQLRARLSTDQELEQSFREFVRSGKICAAGRTTALLYSFGLLRLAEDGGFALGAGLYRDLLEEPR